VSIIKILGWEQASKKILPDHQNNYAFSKQGQAEKQCKNSFSFVACGASFRIISASRVNSDNMYLSTA